MQVFPIVASAILALVTPQADSFSTQQSGNICVQSDLQSKIEGFRNDNRVTREKAKKRTRERESERRQRRDRFGFARQARAERQNAKSNLKIKCDIFIEIRQSRRERYKCAHSSRIGLQPAVFSADSFSQSFEHAATQTRDFIRSLA